MVLVFVFLKTLLDSIHVNESIRKDERKLCTYNRSWYLLSQFVYKLFTQSSWFVDFKTIFVLFSFDQIKLSIIFLLIWGKQKKLIFARTLIWLIKL